MSASICTSLICKREITQDCDTQKSEILEAEVAEDMVFSFINSRVYRKRKSLSIKNPGVLP
jgi:hypothetical protein